MTLYIIYILFQSFPKTFAWSDDSYVSFTNWGVGMPNRHGDDNHACNYIMGSDNLWWAILNKIAENNFVNLNSIV